MSYAANGGTFGSQCYDNVDIFADFRLTGPINTANNTTFYNTLDGTCAGAIIPPLRTQVSATDQTEATAKCQTLVGVNAAGDTTHDIGYAAAPTDWFRCLPVFV